MGVVLRIFRIFILIAGVMLLSEGFHISLKAQTSSPWPNSQSLMEEFQNLKLQTELYTAMDPDVSAKMPEWTELENRMQDKLRQIRSHSEELEKSQEGRSLLALARRVQIIQTLRNKLAKCYTSRKGKDATRAIVQAIANQPEDCVAFASESNLTHILSAIAATTEPQAEAFKGHQEKLLNSLFYNTVLQSAQRYGELTYLVSDLQPEGVNFFDRLCGQETWCQRLADTQSLGGASSLREVLNRQVQRQHQQMREQNIPRRTAAEIGQFAKCQLIGCGQTPGALQKLDHNFVSQLNLPDSTLTFSLDLLQQQRSTNLNLSELPSSSLLTSLAPSNPEDLRAQMEVEERWSMAVEDQVLSLVSEHFGRLESDPVFRILGARTDVSGSFCLGDCRPQVSRSPSTGAMELTLLNAQNLSPLRDNLLRQLHHQPETAMRGVLSSTRDMLTSGLAAIGRELYPGTPLTPAQMQKNLGRLISGNPIATAQTLLSQPENISALCSAIENMEDDNPWMDVLIVAGGVGAMAVGGIVAGPVGLTVASAAVGLGSAAYGINQYKNHSAMARHYQVACFNEVDPISSVQCRQYHQEIMIAQMNLLGAGADILTLGGLSTYRRMLTQAVSATTNLGRSLKTMRTLPALIREVSEVVDESTARAFRQTLTSASAAEREEFLTLYQRAKTYLREDDFHQHLKESVQRLCGQGATR